jgi:hypothetical protein
MTTRESKMIQGLKNPFKPYARTLNSSSKQKTMNRMTSTMSR